MVNDSSVAASRITGSFTGSFVGDGSNLTGVAQDIELLDAYGAGTIHQTQDKFLLSDNGTEKSITFSNLEDSVFANVSGDATVAAGGDLSLGVTAITNQTINVKSPSLMVGPRGKVTPMITPERRLLNIFDRQGNPIPVIKENGDAGGLYRDW